jgi:membrane-bound lytic murein transglycosylase MltF
MDGFNKALFSIAAYNAGPAKINQLREEARRSDLDPNVWFGNVEVAASKSIGRETVQYVSNIFKYYTAYRLLADKSDEKVKAKEKLQ